MIIICKTHAGLTGFEPWTHASLVRQSGILPKRHISFPSNPCRSRPIFMQFVPTVTIAKIRSQIRLQIDCTWHRALLQKKHLPSELTYGFKV